MREQIRPRRVRALLLAAAAATTVLTALSGCTPSTVPDLERTAEPTDALPAGVQGFSGFDPDTTRHIASHRGIEFYLAKQTGDLATGLCLVVVKPVEPVQWASSCSAAEYFGLQWDAGDVNAEFYRHGVTDDIVKSGWSQISENVIVED
ncbi:hypothetical protein ABH923_000293 [Leifsonia sp. EB41]|uniref:hypothetical protein n=1 Tax=Leifsonia sp. EB41 TaxID=3156260 RepID=UPI0035193130